MKDQSEIAMRNSEIYLVYEQYNEQCNNQTTLGTAIQWCNTHEALFLP